MLSASTANARRAATMLFRAVSQSDGASPTIAGNTITGNALGAIRVAEDADPKVGQNVVSD
jgi:parallel beta-helix repeat protein